jgi:hypothetical protein
MASFTSTKRKVKAASPSIITSTYTIATAATVATASAGKKDRVNGNVGVVRKRAEVLSRSLRYQSYDKLDVEKKEAVDKFIEMRLFDSPKHCKKLDSWYIMILLHRLSFFVCTLSHFWYLSTESL